MKISVNWIKQLIDFELPPIDELVKKIGAQLGEVENVENLSEKYQGIPIVKVVECGKLENSDHLNICQIDDGGVVKDVERNESGLVQVLTGAPNVHKGMLAVWLPPGTTVPESVGKDPFVLTSREMRGAMSHGMLASSRELAIGDAHKGILDVDKDVAPGTSFAETYKLNDYVIDIENKMFTHRPDCFGALGVAREIAGILSHKFVSPEWYLNRVPEDIYKDFKVDPADQPKTDLPFVVENQIPELVRRFVTVSFSDVTVKPSPIWLQVALAKIGQKPINNVVDITNFMMQLTGQPLHAYDYDKLRGHKIGVRLARKGEKAELLNGKTYELDEADIVIVDSEGVIGLGGVMGGLDSEVTSETRNIVLECANFDMYSIRKASMRHGLFTDAVTRYTKGQSYALNDVIANQAASMLKAICGAKLQQVSDTNFEASGSSSGPIALHLNVEFVNKRLGLDLPFEQMAQLLQNVEFEIEKPEGCVYVPSWRTDIEIPEDLVEEIGRLHGYDKLPLELPRRNIKPAPKNELLETKQEIREALAKAGANEVLTYSFVHGKLLEKVDQDPKNAYKLANALSPDLQYYRLSLMPSLLEKIHANIKAGYDKFALFEIGKGHINGLVDDDGLPREDELVALVVTASDKTKTGGAAYYLARKYLTNLVDAGLDFKPIPEEMLAYDITKPYDKDRSSFVYHGDKFLGIIGEFTVSTRKNLKLPKYTAGWELDISVLVDLLANQINYVEQPKYPKVEQDISLKVASDVKYSELYDLLWRTLEEARPEQTFMELGPLDIFQKADDKDHKQLAFRLTIASYQKTLRTEEVASLLDEAASAASQSFAATRL